jgi:hypothetical protein
MSGQQRAGINSIPLPESFSCLLSETVPMIDNVEVKKSSCRFIRGQDPKFLRKISLPSMLDISQQRMPIFKK